MAAYLDSDSGSVSCILVGIQHVHFLLSDKLNEEKEKLHHGWTIQIPYFTSSFSNGIHYCIVLCCAALQFITVFTSHLSCESIYMKTSSHFIHSLQLQFCEVYWH